MTGTHSLRSRTALIQNDLWGIINHFGRPTNLKSDHTNYNLSAELSLIDFQNNINLFYHISEFKEDSVDVNI